MIKRITDSKHLLDKSDSDNNSNNNFKSLPEHCGSALTTTWLRSDQNDLKVDSPEPEGFENN